VFIVISAPSGTGKTTVLNEFKAKEKGFFHSISLTTRAPRKGELNGRDYIFVSVAEFKEMIKRGELVEWVEIGKNLYGTPKGPLMDASRDGQNVVLDLDVHGGSEIKKVFGRESVLIFLAPPSLDELRKRLEKRGFDSADEIERKIDMARKEMACIPRYDYLIINRRVKESVKVLRSIIQAESHSVERIKKETIDLILK
jgi:guanylate kinase